ncbi:hypothetical protein [Nodularia sphaerocarpa]|uniref:hypothetical protein n=1 Tax=Nodularia sphaerocarpa TaxID=137816 RepID=UPI001EFB6816|nr:hypothetical protein [Nodularia sphaerocarpa]MDB9372419.1 hypothetical protein [Nodularia sphaerocarpa CS-585]MDB9379132.1 hypothetical protein [Nodularia sphaerocarpa CS-585A2]ULP71015.1 hypothetical protein BDGGKGIB_00637 [Nodularia sphaerocarpa UHCC 0038]
MKNADSKKHYIFYLKEELPKPQAHLFQSTNAAYLGYSIEFVQKFDWENRAAKIMSYIDKTLHPQMIN